MAPSSLNCPTCGAPAAGQHASQCEYCGSTLTSVACPACFGAMFAGMQFCPHCGAKGDRLVDHAETLPCPGCRSEMRKVQLGGTVLFECPGCAGNWLTAEVFTQLCLNREQRGAMAAMVGTEGAERPMPARGAVRYLPCPACKRVMNRENFGRRSGVIIDVCKGHGVWFEPHELQAVMAFVDRGGLERARTMDAERRKAEEALDRLRRTETGAFVPPPKEESRSIGESLIDEALRMLLS